MNALLAINECRLSPKVIAKLGLNFSQTRIFSAVAPPSNVTDGSSKRHNRVLLSSASASQAKQPKKTGKSRETTPEKQDNDLDYEDNMGKYGSKRGQERPKMTQTASEKQDSDLDNEQMDKLKRGQKTHLKRPKIRETTPEKQESDLDYEEEEWDRHRALHYDVSARRVVNNIDDMNDQPGTKDRLFEDKMEVTWDKGSSGLVFYTDAQYWRELESHEEAEDADDWDVDTSEYEKGTSHKPCGLISILLS